ncbi:DUF4278 domain-containing protein [Myxosarcina sp. GI1]|uniref:DUF4278 domain-containing protein n=1 Tax=Myxosarcina sp. GI1 TaxID=1541065 RepID=UPI00055B88B0|nr:DUF4278 domain-containing protein [Myxosarcina sp. GI1]
MMQLKYRGTNYQTNYGNSLANCHLDIKLDSYQPKRKLTYRGRKYQSGHDYKPNSERQPLVIKEYCLRENCHSDRLILLEQPKQTLTHSKLDLFTYRGIAYIKHY